MKILVISYSLTGNNEALAGSVAKELAAEHIRITEPKRRTNGTIFADLIFKKTPRVQPVTDILGNYDFVLFVAPVWIRQVATPLRAYLEQLKTQTCRYAFATISGGADGPNVKLADELKKRVGREPAAIVDLHIADLVNDPKPTRKITSAYKVNDRDIKKLTDAVVKAVREAF